MNIITVNQGNKFPHYKVERLAVEALHWIKGCRGVVCITDSADHYNDVVTTVELPDEPYLKGWWSKLYLFATVYDWPALYLDIDVQVRARVDHLAVEHGKITAPQDYLARYHPHKNIEYINSSIMSLWGDYTEIWEHYVDNWQEIQRQYRGDQEYLWGQHRDKITYMPDFYSESYKWSAKPNGWSDSQFIVYHGQDAKEDL